MSSLGRGMTVRSFQVKLAFFWLPERDRDKEAVCLEHSLAFARHQCRFLVGLRAADQTVNCALFNHDIEKAVIEALEVRAVHHLPCQPQTSQMNVERAAR